MKPRFYSGSVSSRNLTPGSCMSAADRGTSDTPSPAPTSDRTVNSSFASCTMRGANPDAAQTLSA